MGQTVCWKQRYRHWARDRHCSVSRWNGWGHHMPARCCQDKDPDTDQPTGDGNNSSRSNEGSAATYEYHTNACHAGKPRASVHAGILFET